MLTRDSLARLIEEEDGLLVGILSLNMLIALRAMSVCTRNVFNTVASAIKTTT